MGTAAPPAPAAPPARRAVKHWRVFGPGYWNGGRAAGRAFGPADVAELVRSFRRFSTGPHPFYAPFVSVNHDDGAATWADGEVTGCGQDPDGWFWVDLDLSPEAAAALDAGKLRRPSVEFWDLTHSARDRELSGFPADAGMVLRCVTLLGARAEGAKGQGKPPPTEPSAGPRVPRAADPAAAFADLSACIRRFSEDTLMGRDQIIAAICAACPTMTPAALAKVPDDALGDMLAAAQQAAANPPAAPPPPAAPGQALADPANPAATPPNPDPANPAAAMADPACKPGEMPPAAKQMMTDLAALKGQYAGELAKVRQQSAQLGTELQSIASTRQTARQEADAARVAGVRKFLDESADRFTPLQRPAMEAWLLSADATGVRKFADSAATGTELDERKAAVLAMPKLVGAGRKMADGAAPPPGQRPEPSPLVRAMVRPGGLLDRESPKASKALREAAANN